MTAAGRLGGCADENFRCRAPIRRVCHAAGAQYHADARDGQHPQFGADEEAEAVKSPQLGRERSEADGRPAGCI